VIKFAILGSNMY